MLKKNRASNEDALPTFKTMIPSLHQQEDKTIQDMSLIEAPYLEYIVLKNGHIVGALETSGVNVELLSNEEQADLFEDYSALLTSMFTGSDFTLQTIDLTVPVDFHQYILAWRKRYIDAADQGNEDLKQMCASYLAHYEQVSEQSYMTTKKHLIILKEKIEENTMDALQKASDLLDEKCEDIQTSFRNQFQEYELDVYKIDANEYRQVLRRFMNHNGR